MKANPIIDTQSADRAPGILQPLADLGRPVVRRRHLHLRVLSAFALTSAFCARPELQAQTPGTGLIPPTAEQTQWMEKNLTKVKAVQLNTLAVQRVNAGRALRGMAPAGGLPTVEFGREIIAEGKSGAAAVNSSALVSALPASVDNSILPSFPTIRSQGSIGSCACWATTYYMGTHMLGLARGFNNTNDADNLTKLSPKWTYNMINGGQDAGSWFTPAIQIMLKNGAASWSDMPYIGNGSDSRNYLEWSTNPLVWRRAISNRFESSGMVTGVDANTGLTNLKTMLVNGYVCVFATNIYGWQFGTVLNDPATPLDDAFTGKPVCTRVTSISSGHAMTVAGYNDNLWTDLNLNGQVDSGEKGAFLIANSWGNTWKDRGFAWLSYDALKAVSAVPGASNASREAAWWSNTAYYIVPKSSYVPKLLGQFTLGGASRGDMKIEIASSATTTTSFSNAIATGSILNQGGRLNFLGSTGSATGSFVFDLSDVYQAGNTRYHLIVNDQTGGNATSLSDFRLTDAAGNTLKVATTGIPGTADASRSLSYADLAPAAPVITSLATGSGKVGTPFSYTITTTNSATTFGASGLPSGLSVNTATGLIAGTPAQAGVFPVSLTATNANGTGNGTLTLTVQSADSAKFSLYGAGIVIATGDITPSTVDGTDFGNLNLAPNRTVTRTFVISNDGTLPVSLSSPQITGSPLFTVTMLPAAIVQPGSSTSFAIAFRSNQGAVSGTQNATVNIGSSVGTPFTFAIKGSGTFWNAAEAGHFEWTYTFQPNPGLRVWQRQSATVWTENAPGGVLRTFDLAGRGTLTNQWVFRAPGQIVRERWNPGFEIFIPDLAWMGRAYGVWFRYNGGTWKYLGATRNCR